MLPNLSICAAPRKPDVDQAALEVEREQLEHRDDGGRAGDDRGVADRQRQPRRPRPEHARLVDELHVRRDGALREVDRDVRQPDADEADLLAGELARGRDDHHLGLRERVAHSRASNSSIALPSGSSMMICLPPGPLTTSLRNVDPDVAQPGDERVEVVDLDDEPAPAAGHRLPAVGHRPRRGRRRAREPQVEIAAPHAGERREHLLDDLELEQVAVERRRAGDVGHEVAHGGHQP